MNCREIEELLLDDIRQRERREVEEHLEGCERCRVLCENLERIRELNQALFQAAEAPEGFENRVLAEAAEPRWKLWQTAVMTLSLTLVVSGGWLVMNGTMSGNPSVSTPENAAVLPVDNIRGPQPLPESSAQFVEVLVTDSQGQSYIVRVPSTIQIRRDDFRRSGYVPVSY